MTRSLIENLNFLPRVVGAKFFPLFLIAALGTGCNESSVIGLDVQPEGDLLNVGFLDSITLRSNTERIDSIRTDEDFVIGSNALLGKYNDPVFGNTASSIFTQVRLTAGVSSIAFGTSPVCDSVVLSLVYDGTASLYGRMLNNRRQTINVYRLTDDLDRNRTYYSDTTLNYENADDLANAHELLFRPFDSVLVGTSRLKPQARIPLDNSFGQIILNNQGTGMLSDNTIFQDQFLKGLYITANTTTHSRGYGNIARFRMEESKIIVYFHNSTETGRSFEMSLGSVARFMHFDQDYTSINVDLAAQLNNSPGARRDVSFVQGMAGSKVKIEMPYLMSLLDSGAIAINKAELVIPVANGQAGNAGNVKAAATSLTDIYQNNYFSPPAKLIVAGIDASGNGYDLPDATQGLNSTYYNGNYNSVKKEYRFNIARYVQQVLDGKLENNGLYLVIPPLSANAAPNRIVLGGGEAGASQMKLNITLTKLK
jgi:hypothetical protein